MTSMYVTTCRGVQTLFLFEALVGVDLGVLLGYSLYKPRGHIAVNDRVWIQSSEARTYEFRIEP